MSAVIKKPKNLGPIYTIVDDPEYKELESYMAIAREGTDDIKYPYKTYINKAHIKICFNYPLAKEFIFEFDAPNGKYFTHGNIAKIIRETYKYIYDEEEKSTEIAIGTIPNMLNRNTTDGKYGIWGHSIEDLLLNCLYKKGDIYYMSIDS